MDHLTETERKVFKFSMTFLLLLFLSISAFNLRFNIGEPKNEIRDLEITGSVYIGGSRSVPKSLPIVSYKDRNSEDIFYIECEDFDPCRLTSDNITYQKTSNLYGSIKYKILLEH